MGDADLNLEELDQRISSMFERYKIEVNSQEHSNVNSLLYNVNNVFDMLLFNVKYEIHQFMKNKGIGEAPAPMETNSNNDLEMKKAECLIKLQTLTSKLTCNILQDYRDKVEGKK